MTRPYAHPPEDGHEGVFLVDHLRDVADRVEHAVHPTAETVAGEPLEAVVQTLAYVHDIGKATTYFQEYLETGRSPEKELLRYHAPLGSFVAYYTLEAQGFATESCIAGFVAVAKHHGSLPNVAEYVFDRAHRRDGVTKGNQTARERRQSAVARQIKNIDEHNSDVACEIIRLATDGNGSWQEFRSGFLDLLNDIKTTVATSGNSPGIREDALSNSCYGLVLECWSSLVLADKTSAAGGPNDEKTYEAERPSKERLEEYIKDLEATVSQEVEGTREERLNYYRSKARQDVLESVPEFLETERAVATLTLPTGMGKTLSGLSAAIAVRDRTGSDRIIYALPFTSIIDQVVDELEEIYPGNTEGRLLTAHHHLAETTVQDVDHDDAADLTDDIASMIAESWRSGLTVTTFVQLFESLAGPNNRQSMKIPALRNAIVVLDEPQSLPLDWWKLAARLVEVLTEQYDATVIAMTATQPRLFNDEYELIDDPYTYFEAVDRVSYELDPSVERYIAEQSDPKSYAEAATTLKDSVTQDGPTLAICNTIDSARKLTDRLAGPNTLNVGDLYEKQLRNTNEATGVDPEELADKIDPLDGWPLIHLSTRLRPVDRLNLIETAKQLTERRIPVLVISTQLVEAGVDISFDNVYRDMGPIDSVVQAAGRCNRSFERDHGTVSVWWLDSPEDQAKTPAEAVYNRGTTLLPVTAATLKQVRDEAKGLSETDVAWKSVQRYFDRLRKDKNVGKEEYTDFVNKAKAEELGSLSLIDQRRSAEIVVARTAQERELLEKIRTAQEQYDYAELRNLIEETKPLRISVPYYQEDSNRADVIRSLPVLVENQGMYELDVREHSAKFDSTKGFVVPDTSIGHQFL